MGSSCHLSPAARPHRQPCERSLQRNAASVANRTPHEPRGDPGPPHPGIEGGTRGYGAAVHSYRLQAKQRRNTMKEKTKSVKDGTGNGTRKLKEMHYLN